MVSARGGPEYIERKQEYDRDDGFTVFESFDTKRKNFILKKKIVAILNDVFETISLMNLHRGLSVTEKTTGYSPVYSMMRFETLRICSKLKILEHRLRTSWIFPECHWFTTRRFELLFVSYILYDTTVRIKIIRKLVKY